MPIVIVKGKHIVDNLTVINKHIDDIIRNVIDPHVKKFMRSYTQQTLKPYPPKPPQSTYVRTGELRRAWDVVVNRRAGEVAIKNTRDYAPYVIGERQVSFHKRTGWLRLSEHEQPVLDKAVPIVAKAFESELRHFLFRKGLMQ